MIQIPINLNAEALEQLIRQRIMFTLTQALNLLADECRNNVPVDTGELRDSIHIEGPWPASPFYIEGRVVAGNPDIPQGYFQEFGTPAHGPRTAKVMHFFWKGKEIFTTFVAGCQPLLWMTNSTNFALPGIQSLFKLLEAEFAGNLFAVTTIGPSGEFPSGLGVYERSLRGTITGFGQ